ncbi:MAG: glycosyltransferase family 4 protein, partial [Nanoarchaeota archaeon]
MQNKILIIGNGGIAKTSDGNQWGQTTSGDFLMKLKNKGYEVTYIAHHGNKEKSQFLYNFNLSQNGIRSYIIHGRKPKSYWALIKIVLLILTHKNIYIFYPGGLSKRAGKLCQIFKKNYGVYVRGYGQYKLDSSNNENDYKEVLNNKALLAKASYLVTVSPKLQLDLMEVTNCNVYVLKPMINWDISDIIEPNIMNKMQNKIKFLFVGSIHERKGIYELIKVANLLEDNRCDCVFNVVGDGPLLKESQNSQKYQANIKFLGGIYDINELAKLYEDSDFFFFPTRNEGFPRVLYEAMLKGLPIFTTMVSGIPGLMQHNYNCIEIPVRDPEG